MQRTLNYTGRKKIEQREAEFSFTDSEGDVPEFNVVFKLNPDFQYPSDAVLYVEAHYKETRQRFSFGLIANITPPQNRLLDQLDLSGPTIFSIMVVDESGKQGLLLASGEGFRGDVSTFPDENKSSLLTVKSYPMGQRTWKVELESGTMPELHLNNSIPNAIERMRSDPLIQGLILPSALKHVLTYYLWNDDEEGEARDRWLAFASLLAGAPPETTDPIELIQWVDSVVEAFSERFDLCDKLLNQNPGGGQ